MEKKIFPFTLSSLFIFFLLMLINLPHKVYAEGNKLILTEENAKELIIDSSKEIPNYKLLPVPTPLPNFDSNIDNKPQKDQRTWTKFKFKDLIAETAKKYDLDPQLIYATIMTESEGDEYAFRYEPHIKDASFCMGQILLSTAKSLGFKGSPKDLYNPNICIDLIGKYHRKNLDKYGNLTPVQLAIAYNTGSPWKRATPGHLSRFLKWYEENNDENGGG